MPTPHDPSFQAEHFEFRADPAVRFETLKPDHRGVIDTRQPLVDTGNYKVSAEIELGGSDAFLILDVRESPGVGAFIFPFPEDEKGMMVKDDVEFILISGEFNPIDQRNGEDRGYKAIRRGEPIVLGRSYLNSRFEYTKATSRTHTEILLDEMGNLTIRDLNSLNGTSVRAERLVQVPENDYRLDQAAAGATGEVSRAQREEAQRIRRQKGEELFGRSRNRRQHMPETDPDGRASDYKDPVQAQREAAQNIRDQEEAEILAQQQRRDAENARRRAARLEQEALEEEARQQWQLALQRRQQEIADLEEPVREVLERRGDKGNLEVQVPWELPIEDAAELIRRVIDMRQEEGTTDVKIYRYLAKELHPDPNGGQQDALGEERFKFFGNMYNVDGKSFRF